MSMLYYQLKCATSGTNLKWLFKIYLFLINKSLQGYFGHFKLVYDVAYLGWMI